MTDAQLYPSSQESDELTRLVCEYSPLIKRIAEKIKAKLPRSCEVDDLIQCGAIGLLEAKAAYSPNYGASFKTYATMKIRYAIYDGVRKHANISREISQYIKRIETTLANLEHNKKTTTTTAVVDAMGVTQAQYAQMNKSINAYKVISIEDEPNIINQVVDQSADPEYDVAWDKIKTNLRAILKQLPQREQLILALYYNDHLGFKDIGDILQLTEARISQLHSAVLHKLKTRLESHKLSLQDVF